jgi:hypothetical protein
MQPRTSQGLAKFSLEAPKVTTQRPTNSEWPPMRKQMVPKIALQSLGKVIPKARKGQSLKLKTQASSQPAANSQQGAGGRGEALKYIYIYIYVHIYVNTY